MKNKTTAFALLLTCALAAAQGPLTFGYELVACEGINVKWNSVPVTYRASSVSFPSGSTWRNALSGAVAKLGNGPANFTTNFVSDTDGVSLGNGQNEIWFSSNDSLLNGAPAIAYCYYHCYWFFGWQVGMDEADILFDNRVSYTTSTSKTSLIPYGGSFRPFQTTAFHELGHSLYLKHVDYTYNIMGQDWTHIHANGSTAKAYLGEDAFHGAVALYGVRSGKEDVAVVHWKYSGGGSSGGYSIHNKTRIFNSAGGVLPSTIENGEDCYLVSPGQQVQAEFSYENNGTSRHTAVKTGYYISTNSLITTGDIKIGESSYDLGRNTVYTTRKTLTIPSNLTSGQAYWLGVIVDFSGSISEVDETNNATYLPIRIQ